MAEKKGKSTPAQPKVEYKKLQKELYLPGKTPALVQVPEMAFIMIDGAGAPEGAAYQNAVSALYALSFTIKFSKMGAGKPDGYFEYSMMPLEGLWWGPSFRDERTESQGDSTRTRARQLEPAGQTDGTRTRAAGEAWEMPGARNEAEGKVPFLPNGDRTSWHWTSMIRQPAFVTPAVFAWALKAAAAKKPEVDFSGARFARWEEGLCAQALHIGPYSDEPATLARIDAFIAESGHLPDFSDTRRHHELYLGDPRKAPPDKWKTVLRTPVRKVP